MCAIFLHPTSLLLSQSVSNHVLLLSDSKDAARLEDDILSGLTECTIEAWIRWDGFNRFAQPWSFGTTLSCVGLNTFSSTSDLQLFVYENTGTSHVARARRSVELHQWYHLAAVINTTQGLQLYMNGVLIAKSQQGIQEIGSIAGKGPARAGVGPWEQNGHFIGALDELRIWDHARSPDQIRATMQQQASGTEPGLRGLWNFDPTPPPSSSPILKSAQLEGDATLSPLPWESLIQSPSPMIIQGEIKDKSGNSLPNASVELKSGKTVLNRITSDSSGQYAIVSTQSIPPGRPLELVATHLTRGVRTHIDTDKISESGTILQNLTLNPALHLEGSVFTLNNVPFPFVLVEALAEGNDPSSSDKESFFTWSDADGNYRFVNLPKQKYRLRVHLPQTWMGLKRTFSEASGMIPLTIPFDPNNVTVLDTRQTPTYRDLDFHIPAFRKGRTTTFDLLSKLNEIEIRCMAFDTYGRLWVGLEKGGLAVSTNGQFQHVPPEQLKPDRILSLHHDGDRLWIGSDEGLYWQSGFEINIQQTKSHEPLNKEAIWSVYHDQKNRIWIGSDQGLYRFFKEQDETLFEIEAFQGKWIRDVLSKEDGSIWVATWGNGLFEERGDEWKQFGLHEGLVHQHVSTLARRRNGELWIGTDGGLSVYSPVDGTFHNETDQSALLDPFITDIVEDDEGTVWMATQGVGLLRYDDGRWTNWEQSLNIPHQWITSCLLDPTGDLWLGTHSGLSLFDYRHLKTFDRHDGLSHTLMLDMDGNDQGELWFGTQGMGIFYFKDSRFEHISKIAGLPHEHIYTIDVDDVTGRIWAGGVVGICELSGPKVVETYLDSSGPEGEMTEIRDIKPGENDSLWLVSHKSGLVRFYISDRRVETYGAESGLGASHPFCLTVTDSDSIWVGTDRGLYFFDGSELTIPMPLRKLEGKQIEDIEWEEDKKCLWILSRAGIFHYLPEDSILRQVPTDDNPLLERGSQIYISRKDHRYWVGLLGGGMAIFNGEQWSTLDHRDGLPHNTVRTVFEDQSGTIWAGTDAGIFSLIPQRRIPRVNLKLTTEVGTQFYQSGAPSSKPFEVVAERRLTMEYDQPNMTSSQSKQQYLYRIQPPISGSTNWITLRDEPMADIHFEVPGTYKLEYKAFDNELNESSVETVQLRVLPEDHLAPWYRTSEFITLASIILFILLVVVIALLAKYYQHKRRMFRERELHMLEVEQKNTELELAKDEALRALHVKSEFLSTVSHEIRTPMNGMLGMNFLLLNTQLNDEQRDYAETVKHCGEVLLKTINDILDLSKMEAGKLKLHQHPFKFKETLRDALKVTEGNAKKKELLLLLDCDPGIPEQLLGDSQRLSQIIINLVGNSIKFTLQGSITLRTRKIHEIQNKFRIRIEVEDSGIGVSKNLQNDLFEPFTQGDSSDVREYGGSGLGLSICKRLVQAMGGEIGYLPAPIQGSIFWFEIELEQPA